MKIMLVLAGLLLLVTMGSAGWAALESDYRLGPRDHLKLDIWIWGNEPVLSQETTVRPDGKITLAFAASQGDHYRLDAGDTLSINVWDCEELSNPQLVVRPDGKIALPLLGELNVKGLTPLELSRQLTNGLESYVKQPRVAVNVVKFRSVPLIEELQAAGLTLQQLTDKVTAVFKEYRLNAKVAINIIGYRTTRVYVLGEVYKPGICEIERDHTILDAIGVAGGFTKAANRKKIYLIRQGETDQYTMVDLEKLLKKGDLSQNYTLGEGDVLFLARRKADYIHDILPFITSIYQIRHL